METAYKLLREARQRLHIADHMLTQTYPLIKDPKLLLAVFDNTYISITDAMSALLHHERERKLIPPFHDSFEAKLDVFKLKLVKKHRLDGDIITLIHELRNFKQSRQKCSVEFTRKDKLVVCSDQYRMETLSADQLTKQLAQTKKFVDRVGEIIQK